MSILRLVHAADAWGTPEFQNALKQEIEHLGAEQLPLQQGLARCNYALDNRVSAMIISSCEDGGIIHAKAGLFYTGIISGCSCADDPTPVEEQTEYCVVKIDIDRKSAEATITLLPDDQA